MRCWEERRGCKSQSRTGELRAEVLGRERRGDKSHSCLTELWKMSKYRLWKDNPHRAARDLEYVGQEKQTGKVR